MSKHSLLFVFILVAMGAFFRSQQTNKESQNRLLRAGQTARATRNEFKTHEIEPPEWTITEPEGRIVFTSYRKGNASAIYSMQADGSDVRKLRFGGGPDISTDGTSLLSVQFYNDTGRFEIVLSDAEGKFLRRLTKSEAEDSTSPAFSPDGRQIAYQSGAHSSPSLYVMNADGSNHRRLTPEKANDRHPAWSPDGKRIAFSSTRDGGLGIYVMNADGSGVKRISDTDWPCSEPAWSPDGKYIASVVYVRKGRRYFLRVIDARTGNWWNVLEGLGRITSPVWSPDGGWLAFSMSGSKYTDIYITDVLGNELRNLTNHKATDLEPRWMPKAAKSALVRVDP